MDMLEVRASVDEREGQVSETPQEILDRAAPIWDKHVDRIIALRAEVARERRERISAESGCETQAAARYAAEAERDALRAEPKAHDVLCTRCLAHAHVPPLNPNGPAFQECGACIHEVKDRYKAEVGRLESLIATATDFRLDGLRLEAERIRAETRPREVKP